MYQIRRLKYGKMWGQCGHIFFGGDGLYKSIFDGPSFESRCYLEELMLEGLLLFTVKEPWRDINV